MTEQDWVYLAQLTRALQVEGVEGRRAGEFVAEIDSHLSETGADPVEEFGTPFELAAQLATRPGSGRHGWVPPLWSVWLLAILLAGLLGVAYDTVVEGWGDAGVAVRASTIIWVGGIVATSLVAGYYATRRLDGRSWAALAGWRSLLPVVAAAVVTVSAANAAGDRILVVIPTSVFWGAVVVAAPLLTLVIIKRNNPVQFPAHARHLRRLKRGPLAGRPPTDPVRPR